MSLADIARLGWRTMVKTYPEQVTFFVTARCNFRCKMCFYTKEKPTDELSFNEYEKISRSMPDFHWMLISGGEPFLRDDLPRICRLFIENNRVRKINIPTNAYFPSQIIPAVEEILKINPDCFLNFGLSLHAPGKKHDDITGVPGSFDRVMETYRAVQPLRKRYKNMGLSIVSVNSSCTEEDMQELIQFIFDEMDVDDICLALARGEPRMAGVMSFSPDLYFQNCRFLHERIEQRKGYYFALPLRGFFISKDILLRDIIFRVLTMNSFQIPCYAGRISSVISETGDLYACELLDRSFGNLREGGYDFRKLWRSSRRKRVVKEIARKKCFCTHECSITTNILFNPMLYGRLIRTWLKLRRGQKQFLFTSGVRARKGGCAMSVPRQ